MINWRCLSKDNWVSARSWNISFMALMALKRMVVVDQGTLQKHRNEVSTKLICWYSFCALIMALCMFHKSNSCNSTSTVWKKFSIVWCYSYSLTNLINAQKSFNMSLRSQIRARTELQSICKIHKAQKTLNLEYYHISHLLMHIRGKKEW